MSNQLLIYQINSILLMSNQLCVETKLIIDFINLFNWDTCQTTMMPSGPMTSKLQASKIYNWLIRQSISIFLRFESNHMRLPMGMAIENGWVNWFCQRLRKSGR